MKSNLDQLRKFKGLVENVGAIMFLGALPIGIIAWIWIGAIGFKVTLTIIILLCLIGFILSNITDMIRDLEKETQR